jgi:hypothetical protein
MPLIDWGIPMRLKLKASHCIGLAIGSLACIANAQLTDVIQAPNAINAGIGKSLEQQAGAGRGDELTPGSSLYLLARDPARAVLRGRQLFQCKFTENQG